MYVSPALQRGESVQQLPLSPVGATQKCKSIDKMKLSSQPLHRIGNTFHQRGVYTSTVIPNWMSSTIANRGLARPSPFGRTEIEFGRQAMFEDSTFESLGTIRTRSRGWMIATSAFNGSILLALILVPLIYPSTLPHMTFVDFIEAPPPIPEPEPQPLPKSAVLVKTQFSSDAFTAPRKIPTTIVEPDRPEIIEGVNLAQLDSGPGNDPFAEAHSHPIVRQQTQGPVRVSGMIVEGLLIDKRLPVYPAIAKASGTQGTIVLAASISRSGTIENLRVVSGPQMLQQAAIDAVKAWRYRPYLLSGKPVEVETTINVIFSLHD
jgi:periplasmic protein TonB